MVGSVLLGRFHYKSLSAVLKNNMDTNDHVFDAGSAANEPAPLYPLYTTSGSVTDRSENLSCSSSSSFCYLYVRPVCPSLPSLTARRCAFAGETGMSVDIRAHIRDLSKRGFELPAIARAVAKIYRRDIQPHVEHTRLDGTVRPMPGFPRAPLTPPRWCSRLNGRSSRSTDT